MKDLSTMSIDNLEDVVADNTNESAAAANELYQRYSEGDDVTEPDDDQAAYWKKKASELGWSYENENELSELANDGASEDNNQAPKNGSEVSNDLSSKYKDYISGNYAKMTVRLLKTKANGGDPFAYISLALQHMDNDEFSQAETYLQDAADLTESQSSISDEMLYKLNILIGQTYQKIGETKTTDNLNDLQQAEKHYFNALELNVSKQDPKRLEYLSAFYDYHEIRGSEENRAKIRRLEAEHDSTMCLKMAIRAYNNKRRMTAVEYFQQCLTADNSEDQPDAVAVSKLYLALLHQVDEDGEIPDINTEVQNCAELLRSESGPLIIDYFPNAFYEKMSFVLFDDKYEEVCWKYAEKFKPAENVLIKKYAEKNNSDADLTEEQKTILNNILPESNMRLSNSDTPHKSRKKIKLNKKAVIIFAAVLIIAVLIFYFTAIRTTKVDPTPYLTVTFSGVNEYGTANVTFDAEAFKQKAHIEQHNDDSQSLVDIDVENNKKLKNGDHVKVNLSETDDLSEQRVVLSKTSEEFVVEGLEKGTTVDAFEDLSVQFQGTNGSSKVIITNNSEDPFIKTLKYSTDKKTSSSLNNEDTITINVSADSNNVNEYKKYPAKSSKEYTVYGLGTYAASVDSISRNDLTILSNSFLKTIDAALRSNDDTNVAVFGGLVPADHYEHDAGLETAYLVSGDNTGDGLKSVGDYENSAAKHNFLLLVYKASNDYGMSVTHYFPVIVSDVVINDDGTINDIDDLIDNAVIDWSAGSTYDGFSGHNKDINDIYDYYIAGYSVSCAVSQLAN